jgi:tungstate transport system ATP-binding protein
MIAANIGKEYQGNQVLRDCSFSFTEQAIYVLTGVNGCGKSTFLRICALLEAPDQGEIRYGDEHAVHPKDLRLKRRITLVLPKVGVFNTSVLNNIAYGLRIRGIRGTEAERKVADALEYVRLTHKRDQNALTLSSGETQRLGIARALVIQPEFLFLDEPTASVDQQNTLIIEEIIRNMKRDCVATVVITTHDQEQAKRLADTLMVMHDGKISTG